MSKKNIFGPDAQLKIGKMIPIHDIKESNPSTSTSRPTTSASNAFQFTAHFPNSKKCVSLSDSFKSSTFKFDTSNLFFVTIFYETSTS